MKILDAEQKVDIARHSVMIRCGESNSSHWMMVIMPCNKDYTMGQELSTQSSRYAQYSKLYRTAISVITRECDTVHFQLPHCNEMKVTRHLSGFGCRIELSFKMCDAQWQVWESDMASLNTPLKMAFEDAVSTALDLNKRVRTRVNKRIKELLNEEH